MTDLASALGDQRAAASYLKQAVALAEAWVEAKQAAFGAGVEPSGYIANELWLAIDARCSSKLRLSRLEDTLRK